MDAFTKYMEPILAKKEGGAYTNNPADKGGPTKWGVTEHTARACGYLGDMRDLTMDQALVIDKALFWMQPGLDSIDMLFPALAAYMLDLGVNMGPLWPAYFVQRALNVLNRQAQDWSDIEVDGHFGILSRGALAALLKKRGPEGGQVLMSMVRAQASVRYIEIAEHDPRQEVFEYGWQHWRAFAPPTAET